jgi:N4-gp56 family major capsid protein
MTVATGTGTTKFGDISQRTAAWAATEMLAHAEPILVLSKMGMTKPMPKNKAERSSSGVRSPSPRYRAGGRGRHAQTAQKVLYEDVTVTLQAVRSPHRDHRRVVDLCRGPGSPDASMLAGEQAGSTIEQVLYGVLRAGTNVFYANGASRSAVNTPITLAKQRAVTRALNAQKAQKITRVCWPAGTGYGTSGHRGRAIVAVAHTDLEHDIRQLAGFVPTAKYGTRQTDLRLRDRRGGQCSLCPVARTRALPRARAGLKAAPAPPWSRPRHQRGRLSGPLLRTGGFASVPLKGAEAITPMVVNAKPNSADPMAQRNYVSWKTWFAPSSSTNCGWPGWKWPRPPSDERGGFGPLLYI